MKANSGKAVLAILITSVIGGAALLWASQGGLEKLLMRDVHSGEIVTCKHCNTEISNTVTVLKVPFWDTDQYGVKSTQAYCDQCGNEMVHYALNTRCQRCGRVYESQQESAPRKTEPRDQTIAEGFCSTECAQAAHIDQTIDNVSRKTGDVIGRIGRGLVDGIRQHTH